MTDINYKEGIAKIIENHGATRQSTFVAAEILRYLSSMELPELQKQIAEILEKYVQQVLVDGRSSAEIYADEILAIIQPILAAQRAEIEELKTQLSTARAETAKELYEEFICPMCYRLNPQHAEMDNGVGCKTCADKESYLAPDKEGGTK